MYCNFVNTRFSRHERGASMTGLAIGSIKARDEISEVVIIIFFLLLVLVLLLLLKTKPLGRGSWTHLSLLYKGLVSERSWIDNEQQVNKVPEVWRGSTYTWRKWGRKQTRVTMARRVTQWETISLGRRDRGRARVRHEVVMDNIFESRTALSREHISTKLNSLHFVSHW